MLDTNLFVGLGRWLHILYLQLTQNSFVSLFFLSKYIIFLYNQECEILKEELATTKTKLAGIEDNSFGMDDMVQSLKEEIEELKAQNERLRKSLDDNEKLLRVSENTAGELQNTLSEVENTLSELLGERANSEEHIAELNSKCHHYLIRINLTVCCYMYMLQILYATVFLKSI